MARWVSRQAPGSVLKCDCPGDISDQRAPVSPVSPLSPSRRGGRSAACRKEAAREAGGGRKHRPTEGKIETCNVRCASSYAAKFFPTPPLPCSTNPRGGHLNVCGHRRDARSRPAFRPGHGGRFGEAGVRHARLILPLMVPLAATLRRWHGCQGPPHRLMPVGPVSPPH